MKKIKLIPTDLRSDSIIMMNFPYDKAVIDRVRSLENTRWSRSLKTWYIKNTI